MSSDLLFWGSALLEARKDIWYHFSSSELQYLGYSLFARSSSWNVWRKSFHKISSPVWRHGSKKSYSSPNLHIRDRKLRKPELFKNFICRTNDIHIENISSKLLVLNICYLTYQLWNAVKCLSATFEMAPSFFNIDGKPIYRFIGHFNLDAHIKCLSIASLITRGTGIRVPSSTDFQSHMTFFGTHLCTRIITKNLGHLNFGHQITNKKSVWTMLDSNYGQKICKI